MPAHLETPRVHRAIESPAGALLTTRPYEWLKRRNLPREFRTARLRAVADRTASVGVDAYLDELGIDRVAGRKRVRDALERHRGRKRARDALEVRWETVFWDGGDATLDGRVALETDRRTVSGRWARAGDLLEATPDAERVAAVDFDVPDPDDALAAWESRLDDPASAYAAPDRVPAVETSATVPGPDTSEYWVRFPSVSEHVAEPASAKVFEPRREHGLPTLVFGSGLGMMYDLLSYWPEEEYVGRELATRGYRVVLPESPWHGRRERPGRYSGEPYLAEPPVSLVRLYAAQLREWAVLTAWAREEGAPVVGVGGISLGGIATLLLAGFCGPWPDEMTPDLAFPAAPSARLDRVLAGSELTGLLGVREALRDAGWTDARLAEFAPLLTPPDDPGVPPERVFPFAGRRDRMAPYGDARDVLSTWGVPPQNRTEWDVGHFGVLVTLLRHSTYQDAVAAQLDWHAR
ncbi:alpha/beta hydrolase [Halomicrococcus sp. SG-WS-1]|uniref:alpha/beta hydrolase n=1 Tax=Halomicrococcus sp. SG-WS-1 TaxID=3439057 RepID=UPI003F78BFBB